MYGFSCLSAPPQSRSRRAERRAQGRCARCGRRPPQPGYVECAHCYTPKPRCIQWPGISDSPAIQAAYQADYTWQKLQQTRHTVELACCGGWREVPTIPFETPCCRQVYFAEVAHAAV